MTPLIAQMLKTFRENSDRRRCQFTASNCQLADSDGAEAADVQGSYKGMSLNSSSATFTSPRDMRLLCLPAREPMAELTLCSSRSWHERLAGGERRIQQREKYRHPGGAGGRFLRAQCHWSGVVFRYDADGSEARSSAASPASPGIFHPRIPNQQTRPIVADDRSTSTVLVTRGAFTGVVSRRRRA
jgi:hypothetical protein